MGKRHEEYAKELVEKNGTDKALYLMERCVKESKGAHNLNLSDECDFNFNVQKGHYELAKKQSKKVQGKKDRRIKNSINFYQTVVNIIRSRYAKN